MSTGIEVKVERWLAPGTIRDGTLMFGRPCIICSPDMREKATALAQAVIDPKTWRGGK